MDPSHHQPPSSHKGPLDAPDSQKPAEIMLEVWPLRGCWQDVQPSQELALGAPLMALCTPLQPWLWEPLLLGCQLHVQHVAQPCTVLWWGRQERVPASLSPGQPEDWEAAGGCQAPATRLMEGLWAESGWGSAPHLTLFWLLGD